MKVQPLYLSASLLSLYGACTAQVKLFIKLFGRGRVSVTKANWDKAVKAGLHTWWVVDIFLCQYGTMPEKITHWYDMNHWHHDRRWDLLQSVRERLAKEGVMLT